MSTPPPPPPLDDPTVSDLLECPPLKWGLYGCGRVSHDFCQALKHIQTASVVACAARHADRAQEFAQLHNIPSAYGSYEELLQNDQVDIVYVGTVHAFRRQVGEQCLNAGKHVLLEKPFACKRQDAEYLINLAKEKKVFLMEGMWTRFFPAVELARKLVLEERLIGEVVSLYSDFNFNASDSEEYPTSFFYNRKLGGGASFLLGPYPMAAGLLFFGGRAPEKIHVVGQVDHATGVDLQASMTLQFAATGDIPPALDDGNVEESTPKLPGAGVATLSYGMLGESEEVTTVLGTKGRLTIHTPGHCPTKISVFLKASGRGHSKGLEEFEFPLPADTVDIEKSGGYFYPNSAGFAYEAAAVARCIASQKTCCPQFTLEETLLCQQLLDEARRQLDVKDIYED